MPSAILALKGPEFFMLYLVLFGMALMAGFGIRRWRTRGTADVGAVVDGLGPMQIATLRAGPRGALCTALVGLYRQGRLTVDEEQVRGQGVPRPDDDPLTAAIVQVIGDGERRPVEAISDAVEPAINAHTAALPAGLLLRRREVWQTRMLSALPGVLVMTLGLVKMVRGITLRKPVGFLFFALIVSLLLVVFVYRRFSRVTRRGVVALALLRNRYAALQTTALASCDMLEDDDATLAYALLGRDALSGGMAELEPPLDAFESDESRIAMRRREAYDGFYTFDCASALVVAGAADGSTSSCASGFSCGSSCGGCGGGCGGCGGCG